MPNKHEHQPAQSVPERQISWWTWNLLHPKPSAKTSNRKGGDSVKKDFYEGQWRRTAHWNDTPGIYKTISQCLLCDFEFVEIECQGLDAPFGKKLPSLRDRILRHRAVLAHHELRVHGFDAYLNQRSARFRDEIGSALDNLLADGLFHRLYARLGGASLRWPDTDGVPDDGWDGMSAPPR
jgi:hypothetical protein